jgi:DNA-binding SARP family transcriptional activator/tetratricopeptide (TPR) repeat protein
MADDGPRPVPGLRRKAVLAALALHSGEIVSTDRLASAVWGEHAPPTAVNTLQNHISYLRRVLGGKAAILRRAPGYVLNLGDDATDVQVARRLLRQGVRSADPAGGAAHLREALALWRGRPLADVAGLPWLEEQAANLDLLCLEVRRALSTAGLAAGEHVRLVADLERLATEYTLDERICAQLMLALYRSGRQADALAAYHRLRRTLGEELGIDPGRELRDLEMAILNQDPALDLPPPAVSGPAASPAPPVPAQLPPAVPAFSGRKAELASLDALLPQASPLPPAPPVPRAPAAGPAVAVICAVSGTAGVGKTALAVHWAHRVTAHFPGGQLYVNLRGFDPAGPALDPGEAVRGFLDALGVPAPRIPQGLPAQAGLYRSLVAGRRVLVVLDNAKDSEQVRPLLPGSPGCMVVVTSRDKLTGLVAAEGATPLIMDLPSEADARDLLASRLGSDRVAGEPGDADDLIELCARLPLALAIMAGRAATSPGLPLAAITGELRQAAQALDPFDGGDLRSDIRAVFSCSYRALSADAARLFRLLGLHPGPDIGIAAAASLAGTATQRTCALLAELTRAHLLTEPGPGRYAFHDLLRRYATEQVHAHDSPGDRDTAVRRFLDHYLHTSHRAAELMHPTANPITLDQPRPGVVVSTPGTAEDALAWFVTERPVLLAAVQLAAGADPGIPGWQLAWTLSTFLLRRALWADLAAACTAGLAAARRSGDMTGEAHSLHALASGYVRAGRLREAFPLLLNALRGYAALADHAGQASIHNNLAVLAERQRRFADMLHHAMRAVELYAAADHGAGQAWSLNNVGWSHALLGNYQQAISYCEQALAATRRLGERCWDAATWHSLGYAHDKTGDKRLALTCYERSVQLYRELADRCNEAELLDDIGDIHASTGDIAAARRAWRQAERIFDEIGHPAGDRARARPAASAGPVRLIPAPAAGIGN